MGVKSLNRGTVVGAVGPAGHHHGVQLVRAVQGLVEPETFHQVCLHLEGVNIRERLLSTSENLEVGELLLVW